MGTNLEWSGEDRRQGGSLRRGNDVAPSARTFRGTGGAHWAVACACGGAFALHRFRGVGNRSGRLSMGAVSSAEFRGFPIKPRPATVFAMSLLRHFVLASLLSASFLLVPRLTFALSVVEGSLFDDIQNADFVLRAGISSLSVYRAGSGHLYTRYGLGGTEAIKGSPPYPENIDIIGGLDETGQFMGDPGIPRFSVGHRVLLFLRFDNPYFPIIGAYLRPFKIHQASSDDVAEMRTHDNQPIFQISEELRFFESGRGSARVLEADPGASPLTVEEFVSLLRSLIQRPDYRNRGARQ